MVKIEVTKVLKTIGEEWALVKFRNADTNGVCGGNFGCPCDQIVPGHIFNGNLSQKRKHGGQLQTRFKGKPVNNISHHFKAALDRRNVNWTCRDILFKTFKPIGKLFDVIEHKRFGQLMALQKIGKKTVENIEAAYISIQTIVKRSSNLARHFPLLAKYMSKKQLDAAIKWMAGRQTEGEKVWTEEEKLEEWVQFVRLDPFRIVYHTEYDSLTHVNEERSEFLKSTKHASRIKMAEAAAKDMHIMIMDPRRTRCDAIDFVKRHITKTGDYWMRKQSFLAKFHTVNPVWPIVQHENYVTLLKFNDIEEFIAKEFEKVRHREQPRYKMPDEHAQLDDTQRDAVRQACEHPLFVLHGGAGVGKTSVCRHIVKSLYSNVTCAAPTGKAAQRLKESTGMDDAYTVHRMYYAQNLQPKVTLLLDEQSMQDLEILARVLQKYIFHKIIFVGDTGQLTSVGPGQFLKDLCASGVPQVELTNIYRSDATSCIATNGQKIRVGNTDLDKSPNSFEVRQYKNDEEIVTNAVSIRDETGCRPMVLCNTNGEIANLNIQLREKFNPPMSKVTSAPINLDYISTSATFRYPKWRFAMGDSVINVTNKYIVKPIDGTSRTETVLQVANGDIGIITLITPRTICVGYSDVSVEYEGPIDYNEYLRPAYALTVNKAQGSEYDFVIVKSVSSWGDKRERFYTAVTRAKKKCIVYEVGSANDDCIRAAPAHRKTFLFKKHVN